MGPALSTPVTVFSCPADCLLGGGRAALILKRSSENRSSSQGTPPARLSTVARLHDFHHCLFSTSGRPLPAHPVHATPGISPLRSGHEPVRPVIVSGFSLCCE